MNKPIIISLTLALLMGGFAGGCASSSVIIKDEETAERLRNIPVVEMDLDNAAMSDVVNYLAVNLHCIGHPSVYPEQIISDRTVVYRIPFDTYDAHDPDRKESQLKGTEATDMIRRGPALTIQMEESTMMDVLRAVTKAVNGTTTIQKELITIRTKNVEPPPVDDDAEEEAEDPF